MEQEGEVTIEQILEILENYKLRIPPTVFYDLKADIVNFEEPTTKNDLGVLDKIRAEIEPKCDRINSLASVLPYTAHREIQELLCEIMDLCKAESEDKE